MRAGERRQSAIGSTDRAPSYIHELIHVTEGVCHSAARRHLTCSLFHETKYAYGYGVLSEGRHHSVVRALDYVRKILYLRGLQEAEGKVSLSALTDDLIAESQHQTCAKVA